MDGNAAAIELEPPSSGALLGVDFLSKSDLRGAFDSAASRLMMSLPSASFSGVIPYLALRGSMMYC